MPYKDSTKRRKNGLARRKRYYYRHKELELSRKSVSDAKERQEFEATFRTNPRYLYRLWYSAKKRAKTRNIPFDISPDDIVIPEICPVLGIKLSLNRGGGFKDSSPSVDRRIPALGYVKGNIRVISYRANAIKRDATLDELRLLVRFLEEE